jgi:hypothetical protein
LDTYVTESGCITIGIAKEKYAGLRYMPRPIGPADSSLAVEVMPHRGRQPYVIDPFDHTCPEPSTVQHR